MFLMYTYFSLKTAFMRVCIICGSLKTNDSQHITAEQLNKTLSNYILIFISWSSLIDNLFRYLDKILGNNAFTEDFV